MKRTLQGLVRGGDQYAVDADGNVYSMVGRKLNKLKPWKQKSGYLYVDLCKGGKKHRHRVHKLIALAWCEGRTDERSQVNHRNGDKSDNRASNLHWCTASENRAHAVKNNLHAHGDRHGSAKLDSEAVAAIRANRQSDRPFTYRALAKMYGVNWHTVMRAALGRTWRTTQ